MPMWESLDYTIRSEERQRREEGYDTTGILQKIDACKQDEAQLMRIYQELCNLPMRPDFTYTEPDELDEILAACGPLQEGNGFRQGDDALSDYMEGAWLGRCVGCALGKPVEAYPFIAGENGVPGYQLIREWLEGANAYPLRNYFPHNSSASDRMNIIFPDSQLDFIRFMETDDDIRYLVLALLLNEKKGNDFTPEDVRDNWLNYLPIYETFTAERSAYLNSLNCTDPDIKARRHYTNTYLNPYREWIGAQIRVDHYAYVNAGYPVLAAKTAYQDASFSHTKNGVYGAMFVSAMIAAAFVEKDPEKCVRIGMSVVPRKSRLYEALEKAIQIGKTAACEEDLYAALWKEYEPYFWVHTINNAAAVAACLVYGSGDFEKAVTAAVSNGWDTDCNGATVGSVMGAILGKKNLPEKWTAPLHDTLYSAIPDFHPTSISSCAERSCSVYHKLHDAV